MKSKGYEDMDVPCPVLRVSATWRRLGWTEMQEGGKSRAE